MPRPSLVRRAVAVTLSAGAIAVAAASCGDSAAPTSTPTPTPTLSMAGRTSWDLNGDGQVSERELAVQRTALAFRDAIRASDREAYGQVLAQWRSYADTASLNPLRVAYLRCAPQGRRSVTQRVGPAGGTLELGAHRLRIPAGALAAETEITARAGGDEVGVDFAPHGLRFRAPVEMTLSYAHCRFPRGGAPDFVVAYAGADGIESQAVGANALAVQPSLQHDARDAVVALTDHFSRYRVTTRSVYAVSYSIVAPDSTVDSLSAPIRP